MVAAEPVSPPIGDDCSAFKMPVVDVVATLLLPLPLRWRAALVEEEPLLLLLLCDGVADVAIASDEQDTESAAPMPAPFDPTARDITLLAALLLLLLLVALLIGTAFCVDDDVDVGDGFGVFMVD